MRHTVTHYSRSAALPARASARVCGGSGLWAMPALVMNWKKKASKLYAFFSRRPVLFLALLWVLAAFLTNPIGEFPLNDDWAFARPVKTLCDEGRLEMSEWPVMTLIAHIGWGWLVASIFGFSFTALRISVVVLGLAGVLIVWQTLRELTGDEEKAMLGALAAGFNAIYFNLAYTFMTDVPFFTCLMFATYCYLRALREEGLNWLILATLGAAGATLIRQLGLFLPLAFALAYIVRERFAIKAWVRSGASIIIVYGTLVAYERWMEVTAGLPAVYGTYENEVWLKISTGLIPLIKNTADILMICMIYLGLFMFPLLLIELPLNSRRGKIATAILTACGLATALWLVSENRNMPLLPKGIFIDFALGPPLLRDVFHLKRENLYRASPLLLWAVTFIGCVGAFWLLRYYAISIRNGFLWLLKRRGDGFRTAVQILGMGASAAILLPLAIKMPFDRYLLACVPGLLLCVAAGQTGLPLRRWQRWLASAFIICSAVFAVAGTHDYLAWNRARWKAADYLCKELNFPPTNIDGGFEFNGWHLYDPHYVGDGQKTWWWVHDDEFTLTFGLIEKHSIIRSFPYPRWCPPRRDFIYILELSDINADNIKIAGTRRDGGENIKTADGNILRRWRGQSRPANIAHGSFVNLAPGHYQACFKLAAGRPRGKQRENTGILRVVDHATGKALAESAITDAGKGRRHFIQQELPFAIATNLQVGIQVIGHELPVWLDSVSFVRDKKPPSD